MTKLIRFRDITTEDLDKIINKHYTHWHQFNPAMDLEETINKFKKSFTREKGLPIGYAFYDGDNLVGFCTLQKENLKKYPEIYPWISIQEIAEKAKELGYKKVYLWTDQAPEFYKKIGYTYLQQVEKNEGGYGELFYKEVE